MNSFSIASTASKWTWPSEHTRVSPSWKIIVITWRRSLACHAFTFGALAILRQLAPARDLGVAFQLTNILRDLKEDAGRGRVYLPAEDLCRFGYAPDDLGRGVCNSQFRELMNFEIPRSRRVLHPSRGAAALCFAR